MFLVIGRTFKEGLTNFWRNGWLSVAAVSILLLSLFIMSVLFVITITASNSLKNIQSRINISVYFKSDVPVERIMSAKQNLESYQEVKSVEYISKESALENFKKNNSNEPIILESLKEIGGNPLLASLIVKANGPNQYQSIAEYVKNAPFKDDIGRVNYEKNKDIINNISILINRMKKIGIMLAVIFGIVSILIIFNTVRITIYTHKKEIEVMRLVGASNAFIRLPFIFEGTIYGIVASFISVGLLWAIIKSVSHYISSVALSQGLMSVFVDNFWLLLGVQILAGVLLGIISGWIAMRKYLKV